MTTADDYAANAEYFDLLTDGRAEQLRPVLAEVLPEHPAGPVVDIGAGTGSITRLVADLRPGATIVAVEPSRALRAILRSRLADRPDLRSRSRSSPSPSPTPDPGCPPRPVPRSASP